MRGGGATIDGGDTASLLLFLLLPPTPAGFLLESRTCGINPSIVRPGRAVVGL
jgi:hypothetical protein